MIGKPLKHFGDERGCRGADSLCHGGPQEEIHNFRTFPISDEFREKHEYLQLTGPDAACSA